MVYKFFKWLKFFLFLCSVSFLEESINNVLNKCRDLKEDCKDHVISDHLEDIENRLDYARVRMLSIRNRGHNLYVHEKSEGL